MGCCFSRNKVHVDPNDSSSSRGNSRPLKKHNNHEWDYRGSVGPSNWNQKYPAADGIHQSPVNIQTNIACYDDKLLDMPLSINYSNNCCDEIVNNGHTFQVNTSPSFNGVQGGPLKYNYKLLQFHMHWGPKNSEGSEHLIDNKSYPAEIHFVNWNSEKYANAQDAMNSNEHDGLAVLGIFVKIGKDNPELNKLIDCFKDIKLSGQKIKITRNININLLLPNNTDNYWTYPGSLTTPPCTESVQWILFNSPMEISIAQLDAFRNLHTCSDENDCNDTTKIDSNYRPICPLNDREVKKSFA